MAFNMEKCPKGWELLATGERLRQLYRALCARADERGVCQVGHDELAAERGNKGKSSVRVGLRDLRMLGLIGQITTGRKSIYIIRQDIRVEVAPGAGQAFLTARTVAPARRKLSTRSDLGQHSPAAVVGPRIHVM